MTNEEIALSIRGGKSHLYGQLWEQTNKYIKQEARHYFLKYSGFCVSAGVTIDDLNQCGFLALRDTVQAFEPGSGYKLLTYLKYPLLNRFNAASGIRKRKRDPLNESVSMDKPIGEDETGGTFGDFIPDPEAAHCLDQVLEQAYHAQLHNAMGQALDTLNVQYQNIIRRRYYSTATFKDIANEKGITNEQVRQMEAKALRLLRSPKSAKLLNSFRDDILIASAWRGTGLHSFRDTGASSVERAIEKVEKLTQRMHKGQ